MRKVSVGRILAVMALALLVSGPVFAQDIVVAAGWAPQWLSASGSSTTAPMGVMFNVAGSVMPNIFIVGDLGYAHKDGASLTTFTGGVRYAIPMQDAKARPFIEGLVGGGNVSGVGGYSGTGIAFGIGGGVDVKALENVNVRLQLNYFQTRKYGVGINEVRFGIGISGGTKIK
jgi:opacity protein-like surface antigen